MVSKKTFKKFLLTFDGEVKESTMIFQMLMGSSYTSKIGYKQRMFNDIPFLISMAMSLYGTKISEDLADLLKKSYVSEPEKLTTNPIAQSMVIEIVYTINNTSHTDTDEHEALYCRDLSKITYGDLIYLERSKYYNLSYNYTTNSLAKEVFRDLFELFMATKNNKNDHQKRKLLDEYINICKVVNSPFYEYYLKPMFMIFEIANGEKFYETIENMYRYAITSAASATYHINNEIAKNALHEDKTICENKALEIIIQTLIEHRRGVSDFQINEFDYLGRKLSDKIKRETTNKNEAIKKAMLVEEITKKMSFTEHFINKPKNSTELLDYFNKRNNIRNKTDETRQSR